jgi:hypothetical protein
MIGQAQPQNHISRCILARVFLETAPRSVSNAEILSTNLAHPGLILVREWVLTFHVHCEGIQLVCSAVQQEAAQGHFLMGQLLPEEVQWGARVDGHKVPCL